ncbi:MAG: SGNH/GDSL hydrolase family protein [Acutalibacteraceae bacterium]|nr:SGNH/GDSL hydrolase family protein [Acutalibacteraceae bacterium]
MAKVILFQGDSITDCSRVREGGTDLGGGYARLVASNLGFDNVNEYEFINRGVSGNRIVDLYARIKCDIINLKPDYMSILIGVNDTWHEINHQNGVSAEKYEKIFDMLLTEVKEALPNIKIMVLEPFVLEGDANTATEEIPNRWQLFKGDVLLHAAAAERIAEKHGCKYIKLQKLFDDAAKKSGNTAYWLRDGVHPSNFGHELIKREWLKAFDEIK